MKEKSQQVSGAELARVSGYSAGAVSTWTRAGILTRTRGRYNLVASLEAIKSHEAKRANDGDHDSEGLIDLRRELLTRRIAKLDHQLSVATGKVHDKAACCTSLMEIRAIESRTLHGLGAKLAAQFPEIGQRLAQVCNVEIDAVISRLKGSEPTNTEAGQ